MEAWRVVSILKVKVRHHQRGICCEIQGLRTSSASPEDWNRENRNCRLAVAQCCCCVLFIYLFFCTLMSVYGGICFGRHAAAMQRDSLVTGDG